MARDDWLMTDLTNFIIIMTDQQRADLCRREGFPLDTTPFLDELACQGLWVRACLHHDAGLLARARQHVDGALSLGDTGADKSQ